MVDLEKEEFLKDRFREHDPTKFFIFDENLQKLIIFHNFFAVLKERKLCL